MTEVLLQKTWERKVNGFRRRPQVYWSGAGQCSLSGTAWRGVAACEDVRLSFAHTRVPVPPCSPHLLHQPLPCWQSCPAQWNQSGAAAWGLEGRGDRLWWWQLGRGAAVQRCPCAWAPGRRWWWRAEGPGRAEVGEALGLRSQAPGKKLEGL